MKHRCFDVTTPGGRTMRIHGDPQMPVETLDALMRMAELAYAQFSTDIRSIELADESHPDKCQECGAELTQPARGRRRKYCPDCVARLGHRTPAVQARKTGAENV